MVTTCRSLSWQSRPESGQIGSCECPVVLQSAYICVIIRQLSEPFGVLASLSWPVSISVTARGMLSTQGCCDPWAMEGLWGFAVHPASHVDGGCECSSLSRGVQCVGFTAYPSPPRETRSQAELRGYRGPEQPGSCSS